MPLTTPIKRFNTVGGTELEAIKEALNYPLSGYLAGEPRGGYYVQTLEEEWAAKMGVKHAIACNSATSGLLAAAFVCGPQFEWEDFAVPSFTMSATAAAPLRAWPGHALSFMDCDYLTYCSTPAHCPKKNIGLILVTNLFGQAAKLTEWRELADRLGVCLIEDAAQAPFAMTEDGKLAGTVGDVGVFSLNVHKHLQVGEGGIMVTNDDLIADELRKFINHGECNDRAPGLNLRMTEIAAAMAIVQLNKAEWIISNRISLAQELSDMVKDFWAPPVEFGRHVYYIWAVRVPNRDKVLSFLESENVPIRRGYVEPLHRMYAFAQWSTPCLEAERAHDKDLILFEICSWDPNSKQLKELREIFCRAAELTA